jgi:hypothetical protein
MAAIVTSMNFLARDDLYEEERPYLLVFEPPEGFPKSNIRLEKRPDLIVEDIRGCEDRFSLENDAFQLLKIRSRMSPEDFDNEGLVQKVYLQEVADQIRAVFKAKMVQIFEHVLRKRHETFPISTGAAYEYNQPTSIAHVGEYVNQIRAKLKLTLRRYNASVDRGNGQAPKS